MSVIVIPEAHFPGKLLNTNALRGQTRYIGRLSKPWREIGRLSAQGVTTRLDQPTRVWAEFTMKDNRRRDVGNFAPTVKALVDGFVDAGLLQDDCDGIIEGPFIKRVYPNGRPQIRFIFEPIKLEEVGRPHEMREEVWT